jgi:DNA-binding transcriptional MerR regulator
VYTAQQLADRFDCSKKTIHNLVWEGILPPPEGNTSAARYTQRHVDLLTSYRRQIGSFGNRVTRSCLAERRKRTGRLDPPQIYRPYGSP